MNTGETKEENKLFTLPNKKVKVVPIRRKGGWLNEIHPLHEGGFLVSGARKKYACPTIGKGRVANPLTKEEQDYLEGALAEDLNPLKKDNYWVSHFAVLDRDITILDLSKPLDYINYKVLLLQKDVIAPSGKDRFKKGTYKYFIDDIDFEDRTKYKAATAKKDAYKEFGKLEDKGKPAMIDFLTVYYQNKPGKRADASIDIKKVVDTIISEDIEGFLSVIADAEYENKVFISKAMRIRAILKEDGKYYLPEGNEVIANSLDDLILWLKDGNNNEAYFQIQARIEQAD